MKKLFIAVLLPLTTFTISSHAQKWSLSWSEEFNKNEIDSTVWSKVPRASADWKNYMSDHDSLYAVKDGNLILWGIKNTLLPQDTAQYLTGGIWGMNKKSFGYGKMEIRAKFDCAKGFWPAIWMLPQIDGRIWPEGGEIDIMEHLSHDSIIYQTVHSHYTQAGEKMNPKASSTAPINPDTYNIYGVEKYADSIVFLVNGEKTASYPRNGKENQFPFSEHQFYVILSAQLGGKWVGTVDAGQIPVAMFVDWVRFYEPETK